MADDVQEPPVQQQPTPPPKWDEIEDTDGYQKADTSEKRQVLQQWASDVQTFTSTATPENQAAMRGFIQSKYADLDKTSIAQKVGNAAKGLGTGVGSALLTLPTFMMAGMGGEDEKKIVGGQTINAVEGVKKALNKNPLSNALGIENNQIDSHFEDLKQHIESGQMSPSYMNEWGRNAKLFISNYNNGTLGEYAGEHWNPQSEQNANLLAAYKRTLDPALFDQFKRSLLQTPNEIIAQKAIESTRYEGESPTLQAIQEGSGDPRLAAQVALGIGGGKLLASAMGGGTVARIAGPAITMGGLSALQSKLDAPDAPLTQHIEAGATGAAIGGAFGASGLFAKHLKGLASSLPPKFNDFTKALTLHSGEMQQAAKSAEDVRAARLKQVPDPVKREGIYNWIEAGGDVTKLKEWRDNSADPKLKAGYDAGMKLSVQEQDIANHIKDELTDQWNKGVDAGIFDKNATPLQNYIQHVLDFSGEPHNQNVTSGGKLSATFKPAFGRKFDSAFDLEQAGYKLKSKDATAVAAQYGYDLDKRIATVNLLKTLSELKAPDGKPLTRVTGGTVRLSDEAQMVSSARNKILKDTDESGKVIDSTRYEPSKAIDPALRGWSWVGKDEQGNPVFKQGDIAFHPSVLNEVNNFLGHNALKSYLDTPVSNPVANKLRQAAKFTMAGNQIIKDTMLSGLSMFHGATLSTRAAELRVNPFSLKSFGPESNEYKFAVNNGLMMNPEHLGRGMFTEGLGGGKSLLDKATLSIGDVSKAVSGNSSPSGNKVSIAALNQFVTHAMFEKFLPNLKIKAFYELLERNQKTYSAELANGTTSLPDVAMHTADTVNAAFGHLNKSFDAAQGRLMSNPSLRQAFSFFALAPDFWINNVRYYSKATQGLYSRAGAQPIRALMTSAAVGYTAARMMNILLNNGDPKFDKPFSVVAGGREYGIRSMAGDLYRFLTTKGYVEARLSPVVSTAYDMSNGTNWMNQPEDKMQASKEFVAKVVPISIRPLLGRDFPGNNPGISGFEQFLGAQGLHVTRYSPISQVKQMGRDFAKANGLKDNPQNFPPSQLAQLEYALEDDNTEKVADEVRKWKQNNPTKDITNSLRESLRSQYTGYGSKKEMNDRFIVSLKGIDRERYDEAEAMKVRMQQRLSDLLASASVSTAPAEPQPYPVSP